jgi:hypothetical protein
MRVWHTLADQPQLAALSPELCRRIVVDLVAGLFVEGGKLVLDKEVSSCSDFVGELSNAIASALDLRETTELGLPGRSVIDGKPVVKWFPVSFWQRGNKTIQRKRTDSDGRIWRLGR